MIKLKSNYIRKFLVYLKPHLRDLILMFFLTGINQLCTLLLPRFISKMIDVGIKQNGIEDLNSEFKPGSLSEIIANQTSYILKVGAIMLLITFVVMVLSIVINRITTKISASISMNLRKDLFYKIINFQYEDSKKFSDSSLITRITNDVEQVQQFIIMSTQVIIPPFIMIGGIVMALRVNFSMTWIVILGSIIASGTTFFCLKIITSRSKLLQETEDEFNLVVREQLNGTAVIRGFGNTKFEENRFKNSNLKFANISLFVNRVSSIMSPLLTLTVNLMTIFVLILGAKNVNQMNMEIGEVVAFGQYALMIIGSFVMMSLMVSTVPRSMISMQRVSEILHIQDDVEDKHMNLERGFKDDIELKNVSYKFSETSEDTLKSVSLKITHGEVLGIIGTIGSGKSTLLKLIMGLYNPTSGDILFGKNNLKNLSKGSLIENISYVFQKDTIFSGTIESNLRMGNMGASDEELKSVLKIVSLEKLIETHGLSTPVLQSGRNLSGGQKQRLAIARAILKKSSIYIFDDIFSSIDFKTESLVRDALLNYLKGKTVILVSQRIRTIKHADKIIVLDRGEIKGIGTHDELIRDCSIYKEMYNIQLGGEISVEQ